MVAAMMAKFELVGTSAQGQPGELMAQADSKTGTRPRNLRMARTA